LTADDISRAFQPLELVRYSRHILLPEVGLAGQRRLRESSVLIVGAGGLGSPIGYYLAAAGVGRIGLSDFDRVDLSNLQRQILYGTDDVGRQKVDAARARLAQINPHVDVTIHPGRLSAANALGILGDYDVVIDGTDNFPTRYLVNDACVMLGKPNVYGSIFRFEGQVSVFWKPKGPCYRCLYPEPPGAGAVPNCAEAGVLGVLPGTIGSLQATEAIKLLLGKGEGLIGRLLLFDALEMRFRELRLRRDPSCPLCGDDPTIHELTDEAVACEAPPLTDASIPQISPGQLRERLERDSPPGLLDVRTEWEWAICRLDGARLIPLGALAQQVDELDRGDEIVVYCHLGRRSTTAVALLRERGFDRVSNLTGGIDAWAASVAPGMPRY
jgi:molybdopterin/thiamine biosynthesis adenylyltransferase/rhodanese-related sulfurtransferase